MNGGTHPPGAVATRPAAALTRPTGMRDQAFTHLRDVLGTVAPRHPVNRRLTERRWRLELLYDLCEPETFAHVTHWLAALPAPNTKRNYADDLRHWARVASELCGTEPFYLGAITGDVIMAWRQWADSQGLSARTINRRLSALTSLIEFIKYKTRQPLINPITKYDRPHVDAHDETTATPILEVPEFQAVVAACDTARQALVPVLIYTLAGRVSECCDATLHHVKRGGDTCSLDLRRKGGKGRVFPLPGALCDLIDAATAGRTDGPLLLNDHNTPMDRHAVDRLLNRLGTLAGALPGRDLTPHALRASKLTHMYDEGVEPDDIRRYADHAHLATTMRYIRRRDDDALKTKHATAAARVYEGLVSRWTA